MPAAAMPARRLGDATVSAVGFGEMQLSLRGRPDREDAIRVLHHVLDLGVTFIDTADSYCRDESDKHHGERLTAEALERYDGDASNVIVATKGGLMRPNGRWETNGDPDHLRETIRTSADILGRPIDLWQHHAPDDDVPLERSLEAVAEAVDDGLIRRVGVSNYSVEQLERARAIVDIVSLQNQYSPWHRKPETEGTLDYCAEHGIAFIPWSPLGGSGRVGRLSDHEVLADLADEKGISPHRLVIAWLLAKSPVMLPIPASSRADHAEDVLRAAEVSLSDDEVEQLDRAFAR